ncbi:MAG TPA: GNAT family protein [Nocardioides sp.]|uniref:GNAT family N-acetyltransferase n=1 Tax=Nocardioides sp. TaxID=35761 RepID=UPI002D7EAA43|nr:GNAT family protein [Nocardioides sp.]HET6653036.1 GNAT family protein [Nocardioides sp.]
MSPEEQPRPVLPTGYTIRALRADDAPAMAAAYLRNRDHLEQWDPTRDPSFYTVAGQQDAIDRQLSLVHGGLLGAWVVVCGEEIVGRANLNNVIRGVLCSAAVGYWVDHDHLRRGLASAAVEHACAEALDMGLHRVEAGTMVHNLASQRVLLRAGFEQYGMAPRFLFIAGGWQDHNLYQRILHDDPLPVAPAGTGGAGG